MNRELESLVPAAMRLEAEAEVIPPLAWEAMSRCPIRERASRHRARWPWLVAVGLLAASAVPVAADAPLQQAVLRALGGAQEDPGLYAAATGGNWKAVQLVSAAEGYSLDCSGYYYDGYEAAILCGFRLPAGVASAHRGPFVPAIQLTDAAGKAVRAGMVEGAPGHAVYIFHGALQPGQATLAVTGLPTAPGGVPAARQPRFPPAAFQLELTTSTPAVVVCHAGAATLHGIQVRVSEFVSGPGMTHVTVHWAMTDPAAGMAITGQPAAGGSPPLRVRPVGALPPGLALRTLAAGTLPFHGGTSGPQGATGDFNAAPGVSRFTVEVPSIAVALPAGGTEVIRGPWIIPVRLPD